MTSPARLRCECAENLRVRATGEIRARHLLLHPLPLAGEGYVERPHEEAGGGAAPTQPRMVRVLRCPPPQAGEGATTLSASHLLQRLRLAREITREPCRQMPRKLRLRGAPVRNGGLERTRALLGEPDCTAAQIGLDRGD